MRIHELNEYSQITDAGNAILILNIAGDNPVTYQISVENLLTNTTDTSVQATTDKYGITKLQNSISTATNVAVTPNAVKAAIEALDVSNITGFGAGKTLSALSETDGKISATFQDISILSSQVSDKSDSYTSSSSTLATSKAVKDAIESLDITQINNTAGKTILSITEADGKVGATFQDISINQSQVSGLTNDLNLKLNTNLKGAANGLAELDANGKVPSSQLPSYVDDIIEGYFYNDKFYQENAHTTEINGETGKIYVDLSTEKTYRWSGSAYVEISQSLALGETSSTAYRGDYGASAYAHAVTNKGIATANGLYKITNSRFGTIMLLVFIIFCFKMAKVYKIFYSNRFLQWLKS